MIYAVGMPSGRVRQWFGPECDIGLQLRSGETAVEYTGAPFDACISEDGTALSAFVPPPDVALAEAWAEVRMLRNALLDRWRWTVAPDSPLSSECQAAFLQYLCLLNRLTVDFADPADVAWPDTPALVYPTTQGE